MTNQNDGWHVLTRKVQPDNIDDIMCLVHKKAYDAIQIGAKEMDMRFIDVLDMMVEHYTQDNPLWDDRALAQPDTKGSTAEPL